MVIIKFALWQHFKAKITSLNWNSYHENCFYWMNNFHSLGLYLFAFLLWIFMRRKIWLISMKHEIGWTQMIGICSTASWSFKDCIEILMKFNQLLIDEFDNTWYATIDLKYGNSHETVWSNDRKWIGDRLSVLYGGKSVVRATSADRDLPSHVRKGRQTQWRKQTKWLVIWIDR